MIGKISNQPQQAKRHSKNRDNYRESGRGRVRQGRDSWISDYVHKPRDKGADE
jgi:hypothetical protein